MPRPPTGSFLELLRPHSRKVPEPGVNLSRGHTSTQPQTGSKDHSHGFPKPLTTVSKPAFFGQTSNRRVPNSPFPVRNSLPTPSGHWFTLRCAFTRERKNQSTCPWSPPDFSWVFSPWRLPPLPHEIWRLELPMAAGGLEGTVSGTLRLCLLFGHRYLLLPHSPRSGKGVRLASEVLTECPGQQFGHQQ